VLFFQILVIFTLAVYTIYMQEFIHKTLIMFHDNRRLIVRSVLTLAYYAMIFYVLRLLFFYEVNSEYKDMINIIVGAILASFGKVTDFWFKRDDEGVPQDRRES
jgi:hypothetical protein